VKYLDKRVLEWDDVPQEMITNDKKRIYLSAFARWRIADPLKYFTVVKTEDVAQLNLDKIMGRTIRDVVSAHKLDEIVRDTDRDLSYATETSQKEKKTIDIAADSGRSNLIERIYQKAKDELRESFGIELIDIQVKDLNYTAAAQQATINEMISEREVVVARFEAEGEAESEEIRGEIEERLQNLQADANQRSLELEGEGQAKAIEIKSTAFAEDPDFYQFLETLRLYEQTFDESTTLVLSTDNPLLTLLRGPTAVALPVVRSAPRAEQSH
jgi:membrane protease subunit HflC